MPPVKFEPAIPASERPQQYALDRADIGMAADTYNYTNIRHETRNFLRRERKILGKVF
jgi:hypothetical protein